MQEGKQMQKEPQEDGLVSIIVPVYNAAPFLPRTFASVKNQTYRNWELIFVDDASTDGSVEAIKRLMASYGPSHAAFDECTWNPKGELHGKLYGRVRLLWNSQNRGPAAARNKGLRAAHGRYLAYLDADDYWEPEKLARQYRFMREHGYAFSFTGYEFADKAGKRNGKIVHAPKQMTYRKALTNTAISTITVMFDRRQIPEGLLLMPEDCSREDSATWWNILRHGYAAYGLDEALSVYRRHRGSHSANKLRAAVGTWQVYRKQEGLPLGKTVSCMGGYLARAVWRRLA